MITGTIAIHTNQLKARAGRTARRRSDTAFRHGVHLPDAAHKRIFSLLREGGPLPYPIENAVIYYSGATPAPMGCDRRRGPTTSGRMDVYAPELYDRGMAATIGKGERTPEVAEANPAEQGGLSLCGRRSRRAGGEERRFLRGHRF